MKKAQKKKCEVGARSETGYVRGENQDRMSGIRLGDYYLYIVADGMGGHKGGALAAELTVEGLQQHVREALSQLPAPEAIKQAFERTNKGVYEKAHSGNLKVEGMGSTAVLLLISDSMARIAHVGDSRAYLYRKGRLRQLTRDHSRVQRMVDAGMLTAEQAREHPEASLLDRAMGQKPNIEVDIVSDLRLESGDGILLCSDGLCGYVNDQEIGTVLRGATSPQGAANRLVDLALEKGGYDNITVQFIQYGERSDAERVNRPVRYWVAAILVAVIVIAGLLYIALRTHEPEQQAVITDQTDKPAEEATGGEPVETPATGSSEEIEADRTPAAAGTNEKATIEAGDRLPENDNAAPQR